MKKFAPKPWFAPQPVLIIGTYNKDGVANAMNAAWAGSDSKAFEIINVILTTQKQ